MPVFVHLTSEKNGKRIVRNGIKVCKVGSNIPDGIYRMPVMQDYYISHQWLRELKRQGHNTIIGIYSAFRTVSQFGLANTMLTIFE